MPLPPAMRIPIPDYPPEFLRDDYIPTPPLAVGFQSLGVARVVGPTETLNTLEDTLLTDPNFFEKAGEKYLDFKKREFNTRPWRSAGPRPSPSRLSPAARKERTLALVSICALPRDYTPVLFVPACDTRHYYDEAEYVDGGERKRQFVNLTRVRTRERFVKAVTRNYAQFVIPDTDNDDEHLLNLEDWIVDHCGVYHITQLSVGRPWKPIPMGVCRNCALGRRTGTVPGKRATAARTSKSGYTASVNRQGREEVQHRRGPASQSKTCTSLPPQRPKRSTPKAAPQPPRTAPKATHPYRVSQRIARGAAKEITSYFPMPASESERQRNVFHNLLRLPPVAHHTRRRNPQLMAEYAPDARGQTHSGVSPSVSDSGRCGATQAQSTNTTRGNDWNTAAAGADGGGQHVGQRRVRVVTSKPVLADLHRDRLFITDMDWIRITRKGARPDRAKTTAETQRPRATTPPPAAHSGRPKLPEPTARSNATSPRQPNQPPGSQRPPNRIAAMAAANYVSEELRHHYSGSPRVQEFRRVYYARDSIDAQQARHDERVQRTGAGFGKAVEARYQCEVEKLSQTHAAELGRRARKCFNVFRQRLQATLDAQQQAQLAAGMADIQARQDLEKLDFELAWDELDETITKKKADFKQMLREHEEEVVSQAVQRERAQLDEWAARSMNECEQSVRVECARRKAEHDVHLDCAVQVLSMATLKATAEVLQETLTSVGDGCKRDLGELTTQLSRARTSQALAHRDASRDENLTPDLLHLSLLSQDLLLALDVSDESLDSADGGIDSPAKQASVEV
eukprot:scpid3072/ scgid16857/ 